MSSTKHGKERVKDRLGLSKSQADKVAERAWNQGLKHGECKGNLGKYIDGLHFRCGGNGNVYRVYAHHIYVFTPNGRLVTVMGLPNNLCALADKLAKAKAVEE